MSALFFTIYPSTLYLVIGSRILPLKRKSLGTVIFKSSMFTSIVVITLVSLVANTRLVKKNYRLILI